MAHPPSCYQSLSHTSKSIRLLVLSPYLHPEDHRIQCRLIIKDLDSSLDYEALSYTWGTPDDLGFRVWVNGVHVAVRRNLLAALRVLRRDKDRILWIDALCINQEDLDERNQQVGIMGDIYAKARQVVGWLGTSDPNELTHASLDIVSQSPKQIYVPAFSLLQEAAAVSADVPDTDDLVKGFDFGQWVKWNDEFVNDPKRAASWKELADLCRADYWTRLWIAQEICLARRLLLIFGTDSVAWDHLVTVRSILRNWVIPGYVSRAHRANVDYSNLHIVRKSRPAQLADYTDSKMKSGLKFELKSLMELSAPCFSSERHDKIYGILGLGESTLAGDMRIPPRGIPIDYSQSLFSLYEHVMRQYETRSKESALLVGFSELVNKAILGPVFEESAFAELRRDRDLVMAFRDPTKIRTFYITGKVLGEVLKVSSLESFSVEEVTEIEILCRRNESLAKILKDTEPSEKQETDYDSTSWAAVLKEIEEEDGISLHSLLYEEGNESSSGQTTESSSLTTFFATNGLIGVAPKGIEDGDLIWKVDWTNTIAVIRPRNGKHNVFAKTVLANGVLKRRVFGETMSSPSNSVGKVVRCVTNYLNPQKLGVSTLGDPKSSLTWPQPKFGTFKYEVPPEEEISIQISTPILQAITLPSRWQENNRKGETKQSG